MKRFKPYSVLDYQDGQAMKFAFEKHKGQLYGELPYREHLRKVQTLWYDMFGNDFSKEDMIKWDEQGQSVCWLHDVIEDTDTTKEDLLDKGYDKEVVDAVVLLTKESGICRKDYIERLSSNSLAWTVKVADTHSNLTESIVSGDSKRVNRYTTQLQQLFKFKNFD